MKRKREEKGSFRKGPSLGSGVPLERFVSRLFRTIETAPAARTPPRAALPLRPKERAERGGLQGVPNARIMRRNASVCFRNPAIYCRETRVFRTLGPALTPETRTISLSEPLRAEPSDGVCDRPPASHMTDFRLPYLWHQLSRHQWFPALGVLKPRGNLSLWPFLRLHGFIHLCRKVWKKGFRGAKTGSSGVISIHWPFRAGENERRKGNRSTEDGKLRPDLCRLGEVSRRARPGSPTRPASRAGLIRVTRS